MKKKQLLNCLLIALIAFGFTACDNEPINKDDFVFEEEEGEAGEGEFIATVAGESFSAESTNSIYGTVTNSLIINGIKSNGEIISLVIDSPDVGAFSLTTTSGSNNGGSYFGPGSILNPYISLGLNGGTGELVITEFDTDLNTVSGTFSFIGVRIQLDGNGDPVLDGNGDPLYETVDISSGSFNKIPFTLDDDTGGGTGGGGVDPMDPEDSFFANVEGEEFVDIALVANQTMVGGVPMINVIATTSTGASMRIDIPEGIGVGTFSFPTEPISDGTILYAIYNAGQGGENLNSVPGTGSITITEYGGITGNLTATFSFTGKDPLDPDPNSETVLITDGAFNVDFIETSSGVTNTLTAEVDGVAYEPTSVIVTEEPFGATTLITITTMDDVNNQSVSLQFPIDITAGAFDMSPAFDLGDEKVGFYNPDVGTSIVFTSATGTLTILSYELDTGILEGRFTFSGTDPLGNDPSTYEITNGEFVIVLP